MAEIPDVEVIEEFVYPAWEAGEIRDLSYKIDKILDTAITDLAARRSDASEGLPLDRSEPRNLVIFGEDENDFICIKRAYCDHKGNEVFLKASDRHYYKDDQKFWGDVYIGYLLVIRDYEYYRIVPTEEKLLEILELLEFVMIKAS